MFFHDIRTFPAMSVATKPDIFSQTSGQFPAIFVATIQISFYQDVGHF